MSFNLVEGLLRVTQSVEDTAQSIRKSGASNLLTDCVMFASGTSGDIKNNEKMTKRSNQNLGRCVLEYQTALADARESGNEEDIERYTKALKNLDIDPDKEFDKNILAEKGIDPAWFNDNEHEWSKEHLAFFETYASDSKLQSVPVKDTMDSYNEYLDKENAKGGWAGIGTIGAAGILSGIIGGVLGDQLSGGNKVVGLLTGVAVGVGGGYLVHKLGIDKKVQSGVEAVNYEEERSGNKTSGSDKAKKYAEAAWHNVTSGKDDQYTIESIQNKEQQQKSDTDKTTDEAADKDQDTDSKDTAVETEEKNEKRTNARYVTASSLSSSSSDTAKTKEEQAEL